MPKKKVKKKKKKMAKKINAKRLKTKGAPETKVIDGPTTKDLEDLQHDDAYVPTDYEEDFDNNPDDYF